MRVDPPSHHLGPGGRGRGDSTLPLNHLVEITPYRGLRVEKGGLKIAGAVIHVLLPARKPADEALTNSVEKDYLMEQLLSKRSGPILRVRYSNF